MPTIHERCYKVSMIIVCVLAAPFICVYGICTCGYRCLESHYTGKPIAGPCGTGHRTAMRRWEIEKALKREAPVPLPAKRKRALTIMPDASPQPSLLWRRRKATSNQLQSNFFGRLPLEIRNMVYAFTLAGSDHVHVHRRADRRLSHYGCGEQDGKMCPTGSSWPSVRTISGAVTKNVRHHPPQAEEAGLEREIKNVDVSHRYSEAIGYLYAFNVFCFQDARTMDFFIRTVLPKRLGLLSKVRIEEPGINVGNTGMAKYSPRQIRELLDKLTGLKELRFEHELPDEGGWKMLLRTELEEKGVVVVSRRAESWYDVGIL